MKIWKKNMVAAAVLVTVCAAHYVFQAISLHHNHLLAYRKSFCRTKDNISTLL